MKPYQHHDEIEDQGKAEPKEKKPNPTTRRSSVGFGAGVLKALAFEGRIIPTHYKRNRITAYRRP